MSKFIYFNNVAKAAFENDETQYNYFSKLLVDTAKHEVKEYSEKEANAKIVEKFRAALGIEPTDKPQHVRRAIRANQQLVFTIIEEVLEEMIFFL